MNEKRGLGEAWDLGGAKTESEIPWGKVAEFSIAKIGDRLVVDGG